MTDASPADDDVAQLLIASLHHNWRGRLLAMRGSADHLVHALKSGRPITQREMQMATAIQSHLLVWDADLATHAVRRAVGRQREDIVDPLLIMRHAVATIRAWAPRAEIETLVQGAQPGEVRFNDDALMISLFSLAAALVRQRMSVVISANLQKDRARFMVMRKGAVLTRADVDRGFAAWSWGPHDVGLSLAEVQAVAADHGGVCKVVEVDGGCALALECVAAGGVVGAER